jgi:hypothetical protein
MVVMRGLANRVKLLVPGSAIPVLGVAQPRHGYCRFQTSGRTRETLGVARIPYKFE